VGVVAGAAALKWLLDFVKPNANEAISKWLKPATSEERVVNLYRALRAVDEASLAFVTALKSLVTLGGQTSRTQHPGTMGMIRAVHDKATTAPKASLVDLVGSLEAVNPQLEIYDYLLVSQIAVYLEARGHVLTDLAKNVTAIEQGDGRLIQNIADQAKVNHPLIHQSVSDASAFIRDQFPDFKSLFAH
jgi:hypothetical protein